MRLTYYYSLFIETQNESQRVKLGLVTQWGVTNLIQFNFNQKKKVWGAASCTRGEWGWNCNMHNLIQSHGCFLLIPFPLTSFSLSSLYLSYVFFCEVTSFFSTTHAPSPSKAIDKEAEFPLTI